MGAKKANSFRVGVAACRCFLGTVLQTYRNPEKSQEAI
jgi:hypothetical protein